MCSDANLTSGQLAPKRTTCRHRQAVALTPTLVRFNVDRLLDQNQKKAFHKFRKQQLTYSVSEHNAKPKSHHGHYNVITVIRRCFSATEPLKTNTTARLMPRAGYECSDQSSLVGWSGPSQRAKGVGHRSYYVYRMAALSIQLQHFVGNIHCTDAEPVIDSAKPMLLLLFLSLSFHIVQPASNQR